MIFRRMKSISFIDEVSSPLWQLLQSTRCASILLDKISYKWSSENRFFSTKPSLCGNDAIMSCFCKYLIIK